MSAVETAGTGTGTGSAAGAAEGAAAHGARSSGPGMPVGAGPGEPLSESEARLMKELAHRFPSIDSAVAEMAALRARLTLPKGTVHVFSDIHGEDKKLRHVLSNAAGTLRPLV